MEKYRLNIFDKFCTHYQEKGVCKKMDNATLSQVKEKVSALKGQNIHIKVNKGRNKIVSLTAIIDQVYPSMFMITPTSITDLDRKSYSYNDILCGDFRFVEK